MMKMTLAAVPSACMVCALMAAPTYEEFLNSTLDWPTVSFQATYAANLEASVPSCAVSDPFASFWAAFFGEASETGFGIEVMSWQSGICPVLDCAFRPGALLFVR